MNLLVVDDETTMLESLSIGLAGKGYQVFDACGAQQALDKLYHGEHSVDLVITDYMMSAMNGIDLLVAIRQSYPTLPVMIMTAYTEKSLVVEALKNGCDSFIEKPFSLDQLLSEIERIKLNLFQDIHSSNMRQLLPRLVHQINNPLAAISGFAQMILLNLDNGVKLQQLAEQILTSVGQLNLINKNIMNAGRTEEGKFEPVRLDALLDGCLEMFNGLFILNDVRVERRILVPGLRVLGDRFGLEQVFKNLMMNAIDAMDGRLDKKLSVTVRPLWDLSSVEITIEDTGCGIREELLIKIFNSYFTDKCDGSGLGLGIVRAIVGKHGGKMLVESQVEVGSKITVRFPAMLMD